MIRAPRFGWSWSGAATPPLTLLLLLGPACTGKYIRPTTADKFGATPAAVERGGYLVNQVAACGTCHTPRPGGSWLEGERTDAYLAGGQVIDDVGYGFKVVMPNITSDVHAGVGGWTDDQLLRSIRDGVRADDELLMPPMPFTTYQRLADDDARAVVAYLRTVPSSSNVVDRGQNHFPFIMSFAKSIGMIHHRPARDVRAPAPTDVIKYGEYLATAVAPCWECHSFTSSGPSNDNLFGGADVPFEERGVGKVFPRNLTPDRETGLGNYTAEQIKEALKLGKRMDGKPMAPPMSSFIPHFSGMTDQDLDAMIAYLKSIPAIKKKVPERWLELQTKTAIGEGG